MRAMPRPTAAVDGGSTRVRRGAVAASLVITLVLSLYSSVRYVWEGGGDTIALAREAHGGVRAAPAPPGRPAPGESLVTAARAELRPGETWEVKTPAGGCLDADGQPPGNNSPRWRYAQHAFWLAFRLMPNAMNCTDPDVVLYWRRQAPDPDDIVVTSDRFRIVRP